MAEFVDYYQVLGVSQNATAERVKEAYRNLALKYHPDMGGTAREMGKLNEAYSVLSDEALRANYDAIYHKNTTVKSQSSDEVEKMNAVIHLLAVARKSASDGAYTGAGWLVLGVVVTVGSYLLASPGSKYVIAFGAMIIGGYKFAVAMHYYFNPHLLVKKGLGDANYETLFKGVPTNTSWKVGWIIAALIVLGFIGIGIMSPGNTDTSSSTSTYPSYSQ